MDCERGGNEEEDRQTTGGEERGEMEGKGYGRLEEKRGRKKERRRRKGKE